MSCFEYHSGFVSVVVLNYNGAGVIERCIDALFNQTYKHFEIIVVDNNSSDESVHLMKRWIGFDNFSCLCLADNVGVPAAREVGFKMAEGGFVAFIDNDGFAEPDWLENILAAFEISQNIGGVASLVLFDRNPEVINGAGGGLTKLGYGGDHCFNELLSKAKYPTEVLYPMGCGMVFKREVLFRIDKLDALLFNYYDDVEIGLRTWMLGYTVVLSPSARVRHMFSYSDTFNKNKAVLCARNRIRTVLKYFPLKLIWVLAVSEISQCVKSKTHREIFVKCLFWNMINIRTAMKFRWVSRLGCFPTHMIEMQWNSIPLPYPNNFGFTYNPNHTISELKFDRPVKECLKYGWYAPEQWSGPFFVCWTADFSALSLRVKKEVRGISIKYKTFKNSDIQIKITHRDEPSRSWSIHDRLPGAVDMWSSAQLNFPNSISCGMLDIEIQSDAGRPGKSDMRLLGTAVHEIDFLQ